MSVSAPAERIVSGSHQIAMPSFEEMKDKIGKNKEKFYLTEEEDDHRPRTLIRINECPFGGDCKGRHWKKADVRKFQPDYRYCVSYAMRHAMESQVHWLSAEKAHQIMTEKWNTLKWSIEEETYEKRQARRAKKAAEEADALAKKADEEQKKADEAVAQAAVQQAAAQAAAQADVQAVANATVQAAVQAAGQVPASATVPDAANVAQNAGAPLMPSLPLPPPPPPFR